MVVTEAWKTAGKLFLGLGMHIIIYVFWRAKGVQWAPKVEYVPIPRSYGVWRGVDVR